MPRSYERLLELSREISALASIGNLLTWDQQVYMPVKGAAGRSEHRALIAGLVHQRIASDELHDLLLEIDGSGASDSLAPEAKANIRELRRESARARKVPATLVEEIERTIGSAHQPWIEAREHDEFRRFAPWLEKLVRLEKEWADAIGYPDEPYDALLDLHEPGMQTRDIARFFHALCSELRPLIDAISSAQLQPDTSVLHRGFDAETLHRFSVGVAKQMGFDFGAGRMDRSTHPFCCGVTMTDVRVTTNFNELNPIDSLFATIHEVGHGLYHQGLLPDHRGTPMGSAVSLGVHESQARWWENVIARSHAFWQHFLPGLKAAFPGVLDGLRLDEFLLAINAVKPSLVRVEADEVTYNLHIVLRVELERAMLNGELEVTELPAAWDSKVAHYLGLRPQRLAEGVLQDIHWAQGMFGYFATYTLGNCLAAQVDSTLRSEMPDLDEQIARGEFGDALEWMRVHIHRRGSLYPPNELVQQVTGRPLDSQDFLAYLRRKYGSLYGL